LQNNTPEQDTSVLPMPASWTTKEQLTFLREELVGFQAAQRQQCRPQFLKGLAECWFEKWPEHDALFFHTADAPAMALAADDDKKVTEGVKMRL
jgi:hypothetical protein